MRWLLRGRNLQDVVFYPFWLLLVAVLVGRDPHLAALDFRSKRSARDQAGALTPENTRRTQDDETITAAFDDVVVVHRPRIYLALLRWPIRRIAVCSRIAVHGSIDVGTACVIGLRGRVHISVCRAVARCAA